MHSLNEEKQALLAKMEASRVAYRRMLQGGDAPRATHVEPVPDTFPRSHTMRWIRDHPYLTAAAVLAVVVMAKRGSREAVGRVARRGAGASSALVRNRGRIQVAISLASALARYAASRRG
jgi:hypothetical protein